MEYVGGVTDIAECRQLCENELSCEYLTYYDDTSFPYREACLLLKDCQDRVRTSVYLIVFYVLFYRSRVLTVCRSLDPASGPAAFPTPEPLTTMS